jgi:hypothetical protein
MKNTKIIIIAASLVLAAALALCGCMYFIGEPPEETQRYNNDEMSVPSVIEETPTAQSEMQKKFAAYGREEKGANGEHIFHLFTKEQIEESLQMRKEGKRRSLTFDEISFIINDTVRIYFEYDKIVMTDFGEHTQDVTRKLYHDNGTEYYTEEIWFPVSELLFNGIHGEYDSCVGNHNYELTTLTPYHGDLSEYETYESAFQAYSNMINQIEMIISERLRILDTGTLCYCDVDGHSSYNNHMYGILFDNGQYEDYLMYEVAFENRVRGKGSSYSYLIGSRKYNANTPSHDSYIFYVENDVDHKIFPTPELEALCPKAAVHLSWQIETKTLGLPRKTVSIDLDRWNETVEITIKETSQAYTETHYSGTYEVTGNLLVLTLDNGTKVVIEYEDGKYRFVEAVRESGSIVGYSKEIVFSVKYDKYLEVIWNRDKALPEIFDAYNRAKANKTTP